MLKLDATLQFDFSSFCLNIFLVIFIFSYCAMSFLCFCICQVGKTAQQLNEIMARLKKMINVLQVERNHPKRVNQICVMLILNTCVLPQWADCKVHTIPSTKQPQSAPVTAADVTFLLVLMPQLLSLLHPVTATASTHHNHKTYVLESGALLKALCSTKEDIAKEAQTIQLP